MKNKIMHWYEYIPFIAAFYALILGIGQWNSEQKALLLILVFIHMHFYEEFGYPGGFAWGGIKVEMRKVNQNVSKWQLNQVSALFGNIYFAIIVCLSPLFLLQIHWLVLASIIFSFIELLMHMFCFNIGLKSWYNPGLITAICLSIVSIWYLNQYLWRFNWLDLILALVWIAFNYWISFRSPIFQYFNNKKQYTFSKVDLEKSKRYMAKFGKKPEDYHC